MVRSQPEPIAAEQGALWIAAQAEPTAPIPRSGPRDRPSVQPEMTITLDWKSRSRSTGTCTLSGSSQKTRRTHPRSIPNGPNQGTSAQRNRAWAAERQGASRAAPRRDSGGQTRWAPNDSLYAPSKLPWLLSSFRVVGSGLRRGAEGGLA